jgi:hypothetical protein
MNYYDRIEDEAIGYCKRHRSRFMDSCDFCEDERCASCNTPCTPYFEDGLCEDCQSLTRCDCCGGYRDDTIALCPTCLPIMFTEVWEEIAWILSWGNPVYWD